MIILWTDALYFLLIIAAVALTLWSWPQAQLRRCWLKVFVNPQGMVAALILLTFSGIAFLDSLHFKDPAQSSKIMSVLDVVLKPVSMVEETTYSAPFALKAYNREMVYLGKGQSAYLKPDLTFAGRDLQHLDRTQTQDILRRSVSATLEILPIFFSIFIIIAFSYSRQHKLSLNQACKKIVSNQTLMPWRLALLTIFLILLLLNLGVQLSHEYHVLGTDKVGQDVFYLTLKSVRTGLLLGTITTLVMLPFAIICGTFAGYFRGFIDDAVQYIYTTLSSIPAVLLIVAAVLSIQIFISNHPQFFNSMEQRADIRLLALCIILGVTNWTSLCRILRGETLKLREQDYVQAGKVLGTSNVKIIMRHILPNLLHLILISVVLDFSALVLAEAVLTYVGVGVDPSMMSWGNMINSARLELARDPVVWWPLTAAFISMSLLVLSANLFADAVRDAFDPRTTVEKAKSF